MPIGYHMTVRHMSKTGQLIQEFALNGPHDGAEIASTGALVTGFEHLASDDPNIVKTRLTLTDK